MGSSAGYHHNYRTVAADTVTGAASGAAVGSAVPVVGTAIGAAVGGAAGFLTGLLSGDSPDELPPPEAPPPAPDEVDALTRRAELAKQMRLMAGGSGEFLSGPLGDTSKAPGAAPKAGGY